MSGTEAECEGLEPPLTVEEKQAEGMRGAYECLARTLINATIKIAETEERVSSREAELATLSAQLAETRLVLEHVLQLTSWRITSPCEKQARYSTEQKRALRGVPGPKREGAEHAEKREQEHLPIPSD